MCGHVKGTTVRVRGSGAKDGSWQDTRGEPSHRFADNNARSGARRTKSASAPKSESGGEIRDGGSGRGVVLCCAGSAV